jgi:hypothetical protein
MTTTTTMKTTSRALSAVLLLAGVMGGMSARAAIVLVINPTPGGGETSLVSVLNSVAGTGSSYAPSGGNITQQLGFDTFSGTGVVTFTMLSQQAGHAANHQFGFYTPVSTNPIGPGPTYPAANTTFVVGGASSGKPSTAAPTIITTFGLIFYDPDNTPGASINDFFPSETVWDPSGNDSHIAVFKDFDGTGVEIPNSYLIAVEDLHTSPDNDYNDFVARVTIVPEPATVGLLMMAGLLVLRQRRR